MTINKIEGNLLDLKKGIIVHGCNCQGTMNTGIAQQIRAKWPSIFQTYEKSFKENGLYLGDVISIGGSGVGYAFEEEDPMVNADLVLNALHSISVKLPFKLIVCNAMTQFVSGKGQDKETVFVNYVALQAAFTRIRILAEASGMSVNFPMIGAGEANGDWERIEYIIDTALGYDVQKNLYVLTP